LGSALDLAEGKERGKESAAHENKSLEATNEVLHKHLCDTLEQSNGIARFATENMLATRTAADLVVKKQLLRNQAAVRDSWSAPLRIRRSSWGP
jgi:hypothetical protein